MEREYTFLEKLLAAFAGVNVEWYCASKIDRLVMTFNSLSEEEKKEFLKKVAENT